MRMVTTPIYIFGACFFCIKITIVLSAHSLRALWRSLFQIRYLGAEV